MKGMLYEIRRLAIYNKTIQFKTRMKNALAQIRCV